MLAPEVDPGFPGLSGGPGEDRPHPCEREAGLDIGSPGDGDTFGEDAGAFRPAPFR
ncbi:hypothetical protein [Streptomyces sp. NRRL B-24085]|uniref:hypothetical protein n=1 Tax=Streptomyces sp. NRRL B-24085 TaxID=1709476 RepID=UPI00131D441A|nr:hypothetical protein [Streptomyces sp. NRRL B-24085]